LQPIKGLANQRLNSKSPSQTPQVISANTSTLRSLTFKDITIKPLSAMTDVSNTAAQVLMERMATSAVKALMTAL
jgi:hypothetical protein